MTSEDQPNDNSAFEGYKKLPPDIGRQIFTNVDSLLCQFRKTPQEIVKENEKRLSPGVLGMLNEHPAYRLMFEHGIGLMCSVMLEAHKELGSSTFKLLQQMANRSLTPAEEEQIEKENDRE